MDPMSKSEKVFLLTVAVVTGVGVVCFSGVAAYAFADGNHYRGYVAGIMVIALTSVMYLGTWLRFRDR